MKHIQTIILAAGRGTRLENAFKGTPKPLLPFMNENLLQRLLRQLTEAGLKDISIIVGHNAETVSRAAKAYNPQVSIVQNPRYAEDKNIYSLLCGLRAGKDKATLIVEADVAIRDSSLVSFVRSLAHENTWSVCGSFKPHQMGIIMDTDRDGQITDIQYRSYSPEYAHYHKNLGLIYVAEPYIRQYRQFLEGYVQDSLDHYFIAPLVDYPSAFPGKIYDVGVNGGASFNTLQEYNDALGRLRAPDPFVAEPAGCSQIGPDMEPAA